MSTLTEQQLNIIETVFDGIELGIVAVGKDGAVIFCNQAATNMLGLSGEIVALADWAEHYGIFLSDGLTVCPVAQSPLVRAAHGEEKNELEFLIRN